MATQMVRQTTFLTGEVDTVTWKRSDVDVYMSAAQSLLNCEIGTTGLARKRKGTQLLQDVTGQATTASKMYDFVDKFNRHYIIFSANFAFFIYAVNPGFANVVTTDPKNVYTVDNKQVVANQNGLNYVGTIVTPYAGADLDGFDYTQDNDSIIFTHANYAPGRVYISSYDPLTFAYQTLNIYPLPAYDFTKIDYNQFTVALSQSGSILTFQFTGLTADPGFNADWIGGQIIGAGATINDPVGSAIITAVSYASGTTTFTADVQVPFLNPGYSNSGAQYSIRQPAWNPTLGYPAKVVYYQNRLWLARTASLPTTIFGSKINSPLNYDVGTGRDTEAIVYTIGQSTSGPICWMNAGKQLEVFCENLEFACPQQTNEALTPSTFSIRQQSSFGSSNYLKPLSYINDSYYCTKTGKALTNYHFTGVGLAYTSSNISAASSHLVKNPTNRALLRGSDTSQDNFIYFLNTDNTITAFQFAAEYKLAALTPIQFQADVTLIDIVTSDNDIYILKQYDLNSVITIEKMTADVKVDSYRLSAMTADGLVTGLDVLKGYTVQAIYKGQDYGQYLVQQDGTMTIKNGSEIADTLTIGLLYDVEIKPMYLFAGTAAAPFKKQMTTIYVDYENSLDFRINNKLVPYQTFADIQAGLPLQPRTGTAEISPVRGWNRFETLSITQSSPFDLQITSIAYQISSSVI